MASRPGTASRRGEPIAPSFRRICYGKGAFWPPFCLRIGANCVAFHPLARGGSVKEGEDMLDWMILPYKRYAEFSGRSRRMEYWSFMLLNFVVYLVLGGLMVAGGFYAAERRRGGRCRYQLRRIDEETDLGP